ncbi:MAG: RNA 2'-phosphotransferase [Candidatus Peribacteraceae bacterium]|nr:RNA 2'-phosphotransferase [Candidatus Peribacteraceae bacterium]
MDYKKTSKKLSFLLRHLPEGHELKMDEFGWVNINDLLMFMEKDGMYLTREVLNDVVKTNNKQRFKISDCGHKIKAVQGHSIVVKIELPPIEPPYYLYHGTATHFINSIISDGLKSMNRQHVHLSYEPDTAIDVGRRHGAPKVLTISAKKMFEDGYEFYCAENGVWLTEEVPFKYISLI